MRQRKPPQGIRGFVTKALAAMRHPARGLDLITMPRSRFDYASEVHPDLNAIVMACASWIARTFTEAPPAVFERDDDGAQVAVPDHPAIQLLTRPNPYYAGTPLWYASLIDFVISGNAYWLKAKSQAGRSVELWYTPSPFMRPESPQDGSVFISHYLYDSGRGTVRVEPEDVVHLRYGLDPSDLRRGLSPLKSVLREIFTDDEAANYTAALLRNVGVGGHVLSPTGDLTIGDEARRELKERWTQEYTGDNRGRLVVASGGVKLDSLSFNPAEMTLSDIRNVPEERVCAVLGLPPAVVGLGSGLEQTKVGATLAEQREQAYESCIVPIQRMISEQVEAQLLRDFEGEETGRTFGFDLRHVRVLQEDQDKLHARLRADAVAGLITRLEFLNGIGLEGDPATDDVYLLPISTMPVPRGESPADMPAPAEGETAAAAAEIDVQTKGRAHARANGASVRA